MSLVLVASTVLVTITGVVIAEIMKRPRIFGVILGIYTFQCLSVLAYGLFKGAFDLTAGGLILALLSAGLWLAIEKKFKKGQVSWTSSHS